MRLRSRPYVSVICRVEKILRALAGLGAREPYRAMLGQVEYRLTGQKHNGRQADVYLALIHHPVINKQGAVISSAVTNLDLHDIARAAKTYGVKGYYVVTPLSDQKDLVLRLLSHWAEGAGGTYNPKRRAALELVRLADSLEAVIGEIGRIEGQPPMTIVTGARPRQKTMAFGELRERLDDGRSCLLVFGTAWGLSDEVFTEADAVLEPIRGGTEYNHLSVRSAASIILDRLLG